MVGPKDFNDSLTNIQPFITANDIEDIQSYV